MSAKFQPKPTLSWSGFENRAQKPVSEGSCSLVILKWLTDNRRGRKPTPNPRPKPGEGRYVAQPSKVSRVMDQPQELPWPNWYLHSQVPWQRPETSKCQEKNLKTQSQLTLPGRVRGYDWSKATQRKQIKAKQNKTKQSKTKQRKSNKAKQIKVKLGRCAGHQAADLAVSLVDLGFLVGAGYQVEHAARRRPGQLLHRLDDRQVRHRLGDLRFQRTFNIVWHVASESSSKNMQGSTKPCPMVWG